MWFRPFRALVPFLDGTQSVALGWHGSHLWCSDPERVVKVADGVYLSFAATSASSFTMSAANLRMPSAVFSVAIASSFTS